MSNRIDILLVEDNQQTVGVIAPFNKAQVGDMVKYDDGCIGKVVNRLEWIDPDGEIMKFLKAILTIFEAEVVFNLGYTKEGETDGT